MKTTMQACPICGKPGPYAGKNIGGCEHYDEQTGELEHFPSEEMDMDNALELAQAFLKELDADVKRQEGYIEIIRKKIEYRYAKVKTG